MAYGEYSLELARLMYESWACTALRNTDSPSMGKGTLLPSRQIQQHTGAMPIPLAYIPTLTKLAAVPLCAA